MFHEPGRIVTDTQLAHERHRGDAVLVLGEEINGQEPGRQGQFGIGEHGSGGD